MTEDNIKAIRMALDSLKEATRYADAIQSLSVSDPEGLRARNVALLEILENAKDQIHEANTGLDGLISELYK